MMLVSIGTIGSTHGVNVSSSPAPNSDRITSQRFPDIRAVATRSCSGSSSGAAPAARGPGSAGTMGVIPAEPESARPGALEAPPSMLPRAWNCAWAPASFPLAESERLDAPLPGPAPVSARATGSSSDTVLVIGG